MVQYPFSSNIHLFSPLRFLCKLVGWRIATAVCAATQAEHFNIGSLRCRVQILFFIMFFLFRITCPRKTCCKRLQRTNLFSRYYLTIPNLSLSHFVDDHTILFLRALKTVNQYSFPSLHTCQYHKKFVKGL